MSQLATGARLDVYAPPPLWRHPAFGWTAGLGLVAVAALWLGWGALAGVLYGVEFAVATLLPPEAIARASWVALPLFGLAAGLLASVSPCVLPLVPLNVAYIGATGATGRDAARVSGLFVLGAAAALTPLGLAGDLAGWLLVEQRGPVLLAAGALMVLLGLTALELVPLPASGWAPGGSRRLGPVGAGAAFSLVTTPCASPLVGAVLAAASAQARPGLSVVSMACFALGYTLLVFVAGVFGGGLATRLRGRSFAAPRAAAAALLLVAGLGFAAAGLAWF